jgi:hypothetical protein
MKNKMKKKSIKMKKKQSIKNEKKQSKKNKLIFFHLY